MKLFQRFFKQVQPLIELRSGHIEDLKAFGVLLQVEASNAHFFGLNTAEEIEGYISDLRLQIKSLNQKKFVAVSLVAVTVDKAPVGYLVLMATPDKKVMDLNVLVIDPLWRGRGLARFAVRELMSSLDIKGLRMLVRCLPASRNMMGLLRKLQFKEVPTADLVVRHFLSPILVSDR